MVHDVGAVPENFLSYRVVPDDQAEEVEQERQALQGLKRVLDWQHYYGGEYDELAGMPERIRQGLRETMAYTLISAWVEMRCVETLIDEIGGAFNGIDPLRPHFREKLDGTRDRLQAIQEHQSFLRMDVVLRDPLPEELQEIRGWLDRALEWT